MGGYCYPNNAAIAAQSLRDHWLRARRRARWIITTATASQQIFEPRPDVCFVSIHADPLDEYPYFLGHADERGTGAGLGATCNYPLPHGTTWATYGAALAEACAVITAFRPDAIVVSLGVDTYEHDPISGFGLTRDDFPRLGAAIATIDRPTLFVMEGGYAVDDIGLNAVGVLQGFERR
jgi:acetoin utilization deacetylase AcuC-like enzyme